MIEVRKYYSRPEWSFEWFIQDSRIENNKEVFVVIVLDKETKHSMGLRPYLHTKQELLDMLNNVKKEATSVQRSKWYDSLWE